MGDVMFTKNMLRFIKILKSLKPAITLIFIISIGYSIIYQIILLRIPEQFKYANELGIITFNFALALVASSVFYFIVVHTDEFKNKHKANVVVRKKIQRLINIEKAVAQAIADKSKEQIKKDLYSKEYFQKLFSTLSPKDIAPKLFFVDKANINWLEYLFYFVGETQFGIKEIYQFMPYLDLDLLIILEELESCKYFEYFKNLQKAVFYEPNLYIFGNPYYIYTTIIVKLEKYFDKS